MYGEIHPELLSKNATTESRKEFYEQTYKYWSFGKKKNTIGVLDEGYNIYGNAKLSQVCWMKYFKFLTFSYK